MSATGSVATEQPQPITPMKVEELGFSALVRNSRTEVEPSHCESEFSSRINFSTLDSY